jgi:hypothetical protein
MTQRVEPRDQRAEESVMENHSQAGVKLNPNKELSTFKYFTFMYENRIMKPVEIVLRRGDGDKGESWRG